MADGRQDMDFRHEVYAEADEILAQEHPGIRGKLAAQIAAKREARDEVMRLTADRVLPTPAAHLCDEFCRHPVVGAHPAMVDREDRPADGPVMAREGSVSNLPTAIYALETVRRGLDAVQGHMDSLSAALNPPRQAGRWELVTVAGSHEWIPDEARSEMTAVVIERDIARERLDLARAALLATGYFTEDEVGVDIAPRITELYSALSSPAADGMCPNCVTPWKCNGPHLS